MTPEGRQKAYFNLIENKIDALVVIGGNGTFTGALKFDQEHDFPVVGLPGTIDNDLYGVEYTATGWDYPENSQEPAFYDTRRKAEGLFQAHRK